MPKNVKKLIQWLRARPKVYRKDLGNDSTQLLEVKNGKVFMQIIKIYKDANLSGFLKHLIKLDEII